MRMRHLPLDDRSKEEMLHDGHLLKHLRLIHLQQTTIHFAPSGHPADLIQQGRVLCKWPPLHLLHKRHTSQVHILIGEIIQDILIVNRLGLHILVINELRRAEHKRQKMVIVEAPDAMRAGWLELVSHLNFAHQTEVRDKDAGDKGRVIRLGDNAEAR